MSAADARVSDVAYSTYDGPRAGRLAAIWSLARWSSLRALGARRGWKTKVIPITLILLGFAPALVVLGLRALFGPTALGAAGSRQRCRTRTTWARSGS